MQYTAPSDHPVIRAAFEIAEFAHRGQYRKDLRPGDTAPTPYIEHVLRVHDITDEFSAPGMDDDLALRAAALLHDVLEERPDIFTDEVLREALIGKGVDAQLAESIVALVKEVSDPEKMGEGKRINQADRIRNASPEAKRLKIADQVANMIDCVERPTAKSLVRIKKSYDVCHAASGIDARLDTLAKLTYDIAKKQLSTRSTRQETSYRVPLDTLYQLSHPGKTRGSDARIALQNFLDPLHRQRGSGIVYLAMDGKKRVWQLAIIVDSGAEPHVPPNDVAQTVLDALDKGRNQEVFTNPIAGQQKDGLGMRIFDLSPPIAFRKLHGIAGPALPVEFVHQITTHQNEAWLGRR